VKTLKAAIQAGAVLVLDIQFKDGHQMTRYPAALAWCGKSLLWADTGWPMSPSHAFHRFRGKLTGKGPWTLIPADASVIARIVIREMVRGEQPATDEYLIWRDYRATREGQPYDSAAALKAAADLPLAA
jgi:hypothetical protein